MRLTTGSNQQTGNTVEPVLETRQHFAMLDGLRGVAAISVVVYHFMEIAVPDYHDNFISHGHLAVDFFFCLSGFVIAYAYDNRMKHIGVLQFFKLRLIRLHPLVIIGSVLGLLSFLFDPFSNLHEKYSTGKTIAMFVTSCLLIPYPVVPERYLNFFHLNAPTWSLFWEYVANIVYAFLLFRLRKPVLWMLTFAAALLLCYESYRSGYLGVGWGAPNFWGGGIRVAYSFLAGMVLYRSGFVIRWRLGFLPLSIMLAAMFMIPFSDRLNPLVDPVAVMFYSPFIIALGAGARLGKTAYKVSNWLGNLSYPLYMVHYPFIWIFYSYVEAYKPSVAQLAIVIPLGVLFLLGVAQLVLVLLDLPVRQYFKQKLKQAWAK